MKNQKGFGLIGVMVLMLVLGIALLGMTAHIGTIVKEKMQAKEMSIDTSLEWRK